METGLKQEEGSKSRLPFLSSVNNKIMTSIQRSRTTSRQCFISDLQFVQNEPSNACGLVALSSECVGQWTISLLAIVSCRVETVQSVLRHLVIARPESNLRSPHARNISTIAGNWRFSLLLSCF